MQHMFMGWFWDHFFEVGARFSLIYKHCMQMGKIFFNIGARLMVGI